MCGTCLSFCRYHCAVAPMRRRGPEVGYCRGRGERGGGWKGEGALTLNDLVEKSYFTEVCLEVIFRVFPLVSEMSNLSRKINDRRV